MKEHEVWANDLREMIDMPEFAGDADTLSQLLEEIETKEHIDEKQKTYIEQMRSSVWSK